MSEGFSTPEDLDALFEQAPVREGDVTDLVGVPGTDLTDRDSVIDDDDPEGELQVPLASQEVELERALLKQQALDALNA